MSERKNGREFDEVLAGMMKHVDAPENFAAKVMERAAKPEGKLLQMRRVPAWMSGAFAATVLVGFLAGGTLHVEHKREQVRATAEFELSRQITDRTLDHVRQQLQQAGIPLNEY